MAASIVSRTISSIVDQKLLLNGQQIGRTFDFGTNWSRVRVGCRLCCDPNGNTGDFTPAFSLGICSGTAHMYNDATTTNWLGVLFRAGIAWTLSGGIWFQSGGAPLNVSKRIGTTTTTLTTGLQSLYCAGATTWRSYLTLDITKGSPNYTIGTASYQTPVVTDTSLMNFYDIVEPINPGGTYVSTTGAFDEIAGALDTVNLYWGTTNRNLEVSEMLVYRYA